MNNLKAHLKTITKHRKEVCKICFICGIPLQGLRHDLSKYSISELKMAKYYTGKQSPHEVCREIIGYSPAWVYHKNRNKHHWEYWLDNQDGADFVPIKIPYKYVIEMFCDFVGAGKAYMGKDWTCKAPWDYWIARCKGKRLMHPQSEYLLEKLLWIMSEKGEASFYTWIKRFSTQRYLKINYNMGKIDY